jgi:paraquat-inducible protein B
MSDSKDDGQTAASQASASQASAPQASAPQAKVRAPRRFSAIWLIPLVTVAAAGWIAYKSVIDEGPLIHITFETAEGLTAGKTKVRFKGLDVGTVKSIHASDDLSHVIVSAKMVKEAKSHLNADTEFWVVRPRVSLQQISGLETLVSGAFIAFEPGGGAPTRKFTGLKDPPVSEREGRKFVLEAPQLGSIHVSAPVYHRGIAVGEVLDYELDKDDEGVAIDILIDAQYADLVHKNSVFWNASGIKLNLGDLVNASVGIQSLESLVAGGIAFANPPEAGPQAEPGARYRLRDQQPADVFVAKQAEGALHIVLESEVQGSVKVDDPILYREMEVGKVARIDLSEDADTVLLHAAIEPRYAPLVRAGTVFWNASGIHASFGLFSGAKIDVESLSALLRGGVAFATPKDGGAAARSGATYRLYSEPKKEWQAWAPHIRLPQAPAEAEAAAAAGPGAPPPAPAKPAPAGGEGAAEQAAPEADQTAAAPAEAAADLPAAISVSGEHLSTSALTEALAKVGFTNISDIRRSGSIAHVTADWQGESVALRIDSRTGRVERSQ